jgi:hypothetical protein
LKHEWGREGNTCTISVVELANHDFIPISRGPVAAVFGFEYFIVDSFVLVEIRMPLLFQNGVHGDEG